MVIDSLVQNHKLIPGMLRFWILFFCLGMLAITSPAQTQLLQIEKGWIREAPPGVSSLAAYMQIKNNTHTSLTIINIASSISNSAELHHVKMVNDVMQMRKQNQLVIDSGQTVKFEPGSPYHVMLLGVQETLKHGDEVEIKFELKNHSQVKITIPVQKHD